MNGMRITVFFSLLTILLVVTGCATTTPGMESYAKGDLDSAIMETQDALAKTSDVLLGGRYCNLGVFYAEKGEYANAEKYTRMAIDQLVANKGHVSDYLLAYSYVNLSNLMFIRGKFDESKKMADTSLQLTKKGPSTMMSKATGWAHAIIGFIYERQRQPEHAQEEFRLCIASYPQIINDEYERARVLLANGYKVGALERILSVTMLDKNFSENIKKNKELYQLLYSESDSLDIPPISRDILNEVKTRN